MDSGTLMTRYAIALLKGDGNPILAADFARKTWRGTPIVTNVLMAAVSPGTTTDQAWGGALVSSGIGADFVEALRGQSVLDRLTDARQVPFYTLIPRGITGAIAGWAGGGSMKPLSSQAWSQLQVPRYTAAVIVVLTSELLKVISPTSEGAIRQSLISGVAAHIDQQFLDPNVAEVAGINPASITNGVTPVTSTGSTAEQILADLTALVNAVTTNLKSPVWVMRPRTAIAITGKRTTGGAIAFPQIHALGGALLGISVLTTSNMPFVVGSPGTNSYIALVDSAEILVADEKAARIDVSNATSLQMSDAPTNAATTQTSMYQTNSAALKCERQISYLKAHDGAVSYMEVAY